MVDRISRRIEGRLPKQHSVIDEARLEQARSTALKRDASAPMRAPAPPEASTVQLIETALKESRELVKLEIALAKLEAQNQLKKALRAAIGFVVAGLLGIIALALIAVAIVLALGGTAGNALAVTLVVLVLAGIAAFVGYSQLPKNPLEHTRRHLEDDYHQLKEHLA